MTYLAIWSARSVEQLATQASSYGNDRVPGGSASHSLLPVTQGQMRCLILQLSRFLSPIVKSAKETQALSHGPTSVQMGRQSLCRAYGKPPEGEKNLHIPLLSAFSSLVPSMA